AGPACAEALCQDPAMYVRVSEAAGPTLEDPEDLTRFHVEAPSAEPAWLAGALAGAGRVDGAPEGHVWVDTAWLRSQAAALDLPAGWPEGFEGMLGYARSKGWLDAEGAAIQAHVVVA